MNVETGQIYRGDEEIRQARERGEPIRELTPDEVRRLKLRESGRKPKLFKDRAGSKQRYRGDKVRAKNKAAKRARAKNRK